MEKNTVDISFVLENFTTLWNEHKKMMEEHRLLKKEELHKLLKHKAKPLAPVTTKHLFILAVFFILMVIYTVTIEPAYWPVPSLFAFIFPDAIWQIRMKDKIASVEGGVAGMQLNMIKYKKGFRNLSILMWILLIPYFVWFYYYMHYKLSMSITVSLWIIGLTVVLGIAVFCWRLNYTNKGLHSLEKVREELADLE